MNTWTSFHRSGGEVVALTTLLEQPDRCTLVLYVVRDGHFVQEDSLDCSDLAAAMRAEAGLLLSCEHRCGDECEEWLHKRIE